MRREGQLVDEKQNTNKQTNKHNNVVAEKNMQYLTQNNTTPTIDGEGASVM